jgi:hypothetical protein
MVAGSIQSAVKPITSAFNSEHLAVYQRIRSFLSGSIVNGLYGCAGYIHSAGALFLREFQQVDKPYRFILVDRHHHNLFL